MRGVWVTSTAKPTKLRSVPAASPEAMLLSLERVIHVGAFVFFLAGAEQHRVFYFWSAGCCPTGVEDHEQMEMGVPQEPGRPCCFPVMIPAERPDNNSRSVVWLTVATEDTKQTVATQGIAEQQEWSEAKTNKRESERPDSTVDTGELATQ
ncbi:MAG: hypothetical protein QM501_09935 [Gimesia sp.]